VKTLFFHLTAASIALLALAGCGGSSTGASAITPATPASSEAASPGANPVVATSVCERIGDGVVKAQCAKGSATFFGAVDGAIEKLVQDRPQLFNLNDVESPGSYRVVDVEGYYQGLVDQLGTMGLCAQMDPTGAVLQVKAGNESSEAFRVLTSKGFTARGHWIYQNTCTPASFPVAPADNVSYIRVSFFGFNCLPGTREPEKVARKLPMACDGHVTATPKDPDGRDVPLVVHGGDVQWRLKRGEEFVSLKQWPDQPFNQTVYPRTPGFFKLCATVQGQTGCLGVEVIP
jgi:hypothetical protein